jgi:hypothetical protein
VDEQELHAVVEARRELGPAHEQELIDGFLDRMSKEIDRRVDERLVQQRRPAKGRNLEKELGIFIPLFVIAGIWGHTLGIAAAAAALVVVFLVSELRR